MDEELGTAWLPSGAILPQEHAEDWALYEEEVKRAPPKKTKAQVRKIVRTKLTQLLGKHGFEASTDAKHYDGSDYYYLRQAEVGQQVIFGSVRTYWGEYELGLACSG